MNIRQPCRVDHLLSSLVWPRPKLWKLFWKCLVLVPRILFLLLMAYQVCPAALGFESCYNDYVNSQNFLVRYDWRKCSACEYFSFLTDSGSYQSLLCLKLWKLAACPEGPLDGKGPATSSYSSLEEQLIWLGLSLAILNKSVLAALY